MAAEAEAESPVWKAILAMASFTTSNFTQAQITAANLPHLTEVQITSIVTAMAAHDVAVEASKAAIKAFDDYREAMKIATNEENTSQDHLKLKGDGVKTWKLAIEQANKAANLALEKEKDAKDAASKAYDAANTAIGVANAAIVEADQAELGYASVVLKADPGPEVARTVRIFGSGLFLDRTLPNRNFSREYRSVCYSILSKFIVTLKETTYLDLLVSPKKEEILEKITDLEAYGFYAEWLTMVRNLISHNANVMVDIERVDNLKQTLLDMIAKISEKNTDLQSDVDEYSSVVDQLTSYSNAMQNRFQTHFNINPPNLPVNNNA